MRPALTTSARPEATSARGRLARVSRSARTRRGVLNRSVVETLGDSRALAFAGDGRHLYAASEDAGVIIIRYQRVTP